MIDILKSALDLSPDTQRWIISESFSALWCGLTLAYFSIQLVRLASRAIRIRGALRRALTPLAKIKFPNEFAQAFESYRSTVIAEPLLGHAWSQFETSLVRPGEGERQIIRNPQEASFYFNDSTIIQPALHGRFFDTVPSHLVGAGILGTFVGLAAGVGLASGKLTATDTGEVTDALKTLLGGASLAFLTSIFGLGLSLAFLFLERGIVGSIHRRLATWVEKLDSCLELLTSEEIALEQLGHEKRQTKALESFNDSLIFALEKALDEKVAARLGPALDRVVAAVDALRSDRVDSNVSAMQRLVEEFTRSLTQSTGEEMRQVSASLAQLGDRFNTLITSVEESQQRSRGMIDSAAQNMLDALVSGASAVTTNLGASVEGLSAAVRAASQDLVSQVAGAGAQLQASGQASAEQISAALSGFTQSVARLEQVSAHQAELAQRVSELTAGLRGAGEVVVQAHRGFEQSLEPARAITRSLEAAGLRLADSLIQTSRMVEDISAAGASIRAEHERIASTWKEYEARFRGVDQAVTNAFRELEEGVSRYTEQIKVFHLDADKFMAGAVQSLAAATKELSETVEDLGDRLPSGRG